MVESRFGAALLDADARSRLHFLASHIPIYRSSFWGFEILLDDPAPRADFLWQIDRESAEVFLEHGRESGDATTVELAADLSRRSTFWREFDQFEQEWMSCPQWRRRLLNVWFEVDAAAAPRAKLGEGLDQPNVFWGAGMEDAAADRDLLRMLAPLGRRFYGTEMETARAEMIADSLPDESRVFQMGIMGSREQATTRVCVKHPDAAILERWLAEIEWPGNRARLRETFDWLLPLSHEIALNVDFLADRVGENLGIEVYVERKLSIDCWLPLFDQLLTRRLARADKLEALGQIPFSEQFRQLWVWYRKPPIGFPVLTMNLHHLKLVLRGDEIVKVKAYIGVYFPALQLGPEESGRLGKEILLSIAKSAAPREDGKSAQQP